MLKNYIKTVFRNLIKYKAFSVINIFGLSISMSVCLLIILMLADQNRFDNFHTKKDRIYRILSGTSNNPFPHATTPYGLAEALNDNYSVVETTTRLVMGVGGEAFYNEKAVPVRGFFADTAFFKIFDFTLKRGAAETALSKPNAIVLTSRIAVILFGNEDPMGKSVDFIDEGLSLLKNDQQGIPVNRGSYVVTGVLEDNGTKSHLQFDALISSASLERPMTPIYNDTTKATKPPVVEARPGKAAASQKSEFSLRTLPVVKTEEPKRSLANYNSTYTYVLIAPDSKESLLSAALNDIVDRHKEELQDIRGFKLTPQKLTAITPGIFVNAPPSFSLPVEGFYVLTFITLALMLSSCLNYASLSTARALTRAREIGVRKVSGARRKDLIFQLVGESVILSLFALVVAVGIVFMLAPAFRSLWINGYLNFELRQNPGVYLAFITFAVVIGIVAGLFPALHLSRFQPAVVLKGVENTRIKKLGVRKVLNAFQFAFSFFFIVTSILIYNQFKYHLNIEYGFDSTNIINIPVQYNDPSLIMRELSNVTQVQAVSACNYPPATGGSHGIGIRKVGDPEEYKVFTEITVDNRFLEGLGIKMLDGSNFEPSVAGTANKVIVNSAAARILGYEDASKIIGENIDIAGSDPATIIGVVSDFRFRLPSEQDQIGPLVVRNIASEFQYINVKVSGDLKNSISALEAKWTSFDPFHKFKYQVYADQLAETNRGFADLIYIIGTIAFLAISISCLGLLGMTTYVTERRMKEVGIRKVFGADNRGISLLLSKEFLKVLLIAIIIAAPLTWFVNNMWLQRFPNRVDFGLGTILTGVFLLVVLGLLTIGSQTINASKRKPVDLLRID